MSYKSNRHVLYSCKYHVVSCLKFRRKALENGVDKRLNSIVYQVATEPECGIVEPDVMPDYFHIPCEVGLQSGVYKFVKWGTGVSSRLLRQEFLHLQSRVPTLLTHLFIASTVGDALTSVIKPHIDNQKNA